MAPVSDAIEGRHPVAIICDRLTVDDARLGSKPRHRFDNQREYVRSLPGWHVADETGGQNTQFWLLTEPATKLNHESLPTAF
jgi:hypothetical protein